MKKQILLANVIALQKELRAASRLFVITDPQPIIQIHHELESLVLYNQRHASQRDRVVFILKQAIDAQASDRDGGVFAAVDLVNGAAFFMDALAEVVASDAELATAG